MLLEYVCLHSVSLVIIYFILNSSSSLSITKITDEELIKQKKLKSSFKNLLN